MINTPMALRGMVSAPHHLAAQSGLAVLREGGNAIEAAVAAAATAAVVYPHMNGLGGDGFWLISEPGKAPISIDASGAAGSAALPAAYAKAGAMPAHGPKAACTVAGAVSGWQAALDIAQRWGGTKPLARLFEEAVAFARHGFPVTRGQQEAGERLAPALKRQPGFADHFMIGRAAARAGAVLTLPALADTFEQLAARGLDDFYRGGIGRAVCAELQRIGCPIASEDMARHRSVRRRPLSLGLAAGTVFNLQPPSQGLASLMILGMFQRLRVGRADGFEHVHGLVEATKQAFRVRDAHIADPARMAVHPTTYLSDNMLDRLAAEISLGRAAPWPQGDGPGDTAWIGVIDGEGRAVSYIQSLFHAFGSGVVLADTGILWHNRGAAFSLDSASRNLLEPGRKPRHTLNPAMAKLKDGRLMVYGSMGGEAQPQAQAALFTRYAMFGQPLQTAVSAPRWALGRGWNGPTTDLKVESRLDGAVVEALRAAGHPVTVVQAFDPLMGHAGAVVRHASGLLEGAADPRGDGLVAAF